MAHAHHPLVGVVMGSDSDWNTMRAAVAVLKEFGVPYEARVVSAHRTPDLLFEYAAMAQERGLKAIIAGAGGAAHLPGMLAPRPCARAGRAGQSKSWAASIRCCPSCRCPGASVATFAIGGRAPPMPRSMR
jgi:5-(carboxyamino)imidazole ribonucleotide mutase